jgi:erythromycin esterase
VHAKFKSTWRRVAARLAAIAVAASVGGCNTRLPPNAIGTVAAPSSECDVPASLVCQMSKASVELTPASSGSIDSLDFAAVARAIGNARVVMLGEPWHGDGGAIALRGRLVQYLHEHAGFDVLAYEADFYAVHEAWNDARRNGDVAEVRAQIFPFWTETAAAAPLWRYIGNAMRRGDTLHVAGIDPKLSGTFSRERLPRALADRLARVDGISRADADAAAATLRAALSPSPATAALVTDSSMRALDARLARLEQSVAVPARAIGGLVPKRTLSDDDAYWNELANSLRRNIAGEQRDTGMGANLLWLAVRQYPGKKIIVWAHNNHIASDKWLMFDSPDSSKVGFRSVPDSLRARSTYLGAEARRAFGARLFVLGTTDYAGSYSPDIEPALNNRIANFDSLASLTPAPAGTLERALAESGRRVAFVDLRPFVGRGPVPNRVLDYTRLGPIRLELSPGYDGMMFLRHTWGLNQSPARQE